MDADPLASSTVSVGLAWLGAVPLMVWAVATTVSILRVRTAQVPRWFVIWIGLCILLLSPVRYLFLALLIASSFPVQSFRALIATVPLSFYLPIVFGLMALVGVGLPLWTTVSAGLGSLTKPSLSATRLALGSIVAPVASAASYVLFFFLLEFAGFTTHWLRAEDVIGATNGPALFVFEHGLAKTLPVPVTGELISVTKTDRDWLRNHVASVYLGEREFARYVERAYPELYRSWPIVPK
jgi:hypothetical protein